MQQLGGPLHTAAQWPPKGFLRCKIPCGEDGYKALFSSSMTAWCNSRGIISLCKPGFEKTQELRYIILMLAGLALESY